MRNGPTRFRALDRRREEVAGGLFMLIHFTILHSTWSNKLFKGAHLIALQVNGVL